MIMRLRKISPVKRLNILIYLLAFLSSCTPDHPCADNNINPAFIGFLPSDIDSFVLRAYKANDNFQHLVHTSLVTNKFASIYTTTNDTTVVYINDSNPNHWLKPGFDWQLYIPAKNKTVQISKINSTQVDGKGRGCYNSINSFEADGQLITPKLIQTNQFFTSGYMVYIRD